MESAPAKPATYAGLFLLAMSTLAFELVLTRIFSVTVWYHFAFLAVSLAMFGMTFGALVVDFFPNLFSSEKANLHMSLCSLGFAVTAVFALLTHMSVPIILEPRFLISAAGIFSVVANCFALAVPFMFSGIVVCLALTRFPKQVGLLYGCDLIGAALACLFIVYALGRISAPAALLAASAIGALAAICFAVASGLPGAKLKIAAVVVLALLGCSCLSDVFASAQQSPFRLVWIKGKPAQPTAFEKWNSFSFIRVIGDPDHPAFPVGWGLDPRWVKRPCSGQLYLDIDGNAATYITNFDGHTAPVEYLKYDVTNIAHHLRSGAKCLVMGVGGGRDVLSALVFGQKTVTGVELNPSILHALTGVFGDFAGHLERRQGVHLVNDEARAFITGSREHFDIIQISLVDTWAATASGAFALAENSLYTTDAWKIFIDHLTDNGILSVSRWYDSKNPGEIVRLVSLAAESLQKAGISQAREHILLIRYLPRYGNLPSGAGLGTILVCRAPFSRSDLETIKGKAAELNFDIMLAPDTDSDKRLVEACTADGRKQLAAELPTRVDAPSDDSPYFMQLMKVSTLLNPLLWQTIVTDPDRMQGMLVLGGLTVVLSLLLIACILVPMLARGPAYKSSRQTNALATFFIAIGFGFMFIEISQMQRLSVFLGHPTYGLSVVLFSILAFSGLGSFISSKIDSPARWNSPAARLVCIALGLAAIGLGTNVILQSYQAAPLVTRVAVSMAILAPMGLCLGVAFPTGMSVANEKQQAMAPWFWALNGAASVLGSVLAVVVSISVSISFTYGVACALYLLAALAMCLCQTKAVPVLGNQIAK